MKKVCGYLLLISSYAANAASMANSDITTWYNNSTQAKWRSMGWTEWDSLTETNGNNTLANHGFYTVEIGKQVQHYVDVSLMYLTHETFNYQMYQPTATPGKLGNTSNNPTVNLNNRALLVSGFLHPDHDWYKISTLSLSPFIGGGVGYALNQIDNFYPTLSPSDTGSNPSIAINSFAWQASAGLSIHPVSDLSLNVGYRYYDGGGFDTTHSAFTSNPQFTKNLSLTNPWTGHVANNQLFLDFKYRM